MERGKYYKFTFALRRGQGNPPPDTKAKLLEETNTTYKVDVDGHIVTWDKLNIREVVPVVAGGKRKTRKGRKGTRKSHRKSHRKSRRSCRKGSRKAYRK